MKWFIYAIKNIFNYQGRARRSEYGWFQLVNYLLQMAFMLVFWLIIAGAAAGSMALGRNEETMLMGVSIVAIVVYALLLLYQVVIFLVSLSVTARRLHDLGWSGWWQLVLFVLPLIIIVIFIINMPTNMPSERDLAQAMFFPFLMMGIYAIVAFVVMCILLFKEGQIGANKYGEDPKEEERALLQHMREQIAAKKMQEKALTSPNSAENTLEQNSN